MGYRRQRDLNLIAILEATIRGYRKRMIDLRPQTKDLQPKLD